MEALFLPADDGGERLVVVHVPTATAPRGLVLYLAPLGEEANKCRRMAALGARALARAGFVVVQADLFATGDSSGELAQASGLRWQADIDAVLRWAAPRFPGPLWLWGLRSGALLAAAALPRWPQAQLLLWQPVLKGEEFVRWQQRQLAMRPAGLPSVVAADAATLEVGGYAWPRALLNEIGAWRLLPPPGAAPRCLVWLEAAAGDPSQAPTLLPAGAPVRAAFEAAGWQVQAQATLGPPFWRTVEVEVALPLLDATAHSLVAAEGTVLVRA